MGVDVDTGVGNGWTDVFKTAGLVGSVNGLAVDGARGAIVSGGVDKSVAGKSKGLG
ncbi:hypothetical protein HYS42_01890 [Candidatus Saccharibacteria bacterium]|nr:hypothetical protein [Candidatus Saccharibacteria bacterium]